MQLRNRFREEEKKGWKVTRQNKSVWVHRNQRMLDEAAFDFCVCGHSRAAHNPLCGFCHCQKFTH